MSFTLPCSACTPGTSRQERAEVLPFQIRALTMKTSPKRALPLTVPLETESWVKLCTLSLQVCHPVAAHTGCDGHFYWVTLFDALTSCTIYCNMNCQYWDDAEMNLLLMLTNGSCSRHCRDLLSVAIKVDTFVKLIQPILSKCEKYLHIFIIHHYFMNYKESNKCRETNEYNMWTLQNYTNNSYCVTSDMVWKAQLSSPVICSHPCINRMCRA